MTHRCPKIFMYSNKRLLHNRLTVQFEGSKNYYYSSHLCMLLGSKNSSYFVPAFLLMFGIACQLEKYD